MSVLQERQYKKMIEIEQDSGIALGPFHQDYLLMKHPSSQAREYMRLAKLHPNWQMTRQGFAGMDINDVNTAAFTARNTLATEMNMIGDTAAGATPQAMINQYCAIAANDPRAGKVYELRLSGRYGNTGTPTIILTPRWGTSTTVATNITLGASGTWTSITATTALPFIILFEMNIRTAPPGATLGTGLGNGVAHMGIPVTSSQFIAALYMGNTAATIDTSGQGAAGVGLTMNITWSASSASNTSTCESYRIRSLN